MRDKSIDIFTDADSRNDFGLKTRTFHSKIWRFNFGLGVGIMLLLVLDSMTPNHERERQILEI